VYFFESRKKRIRQSSAFKRITMVSIFNGRKKNRFDKIEKAIKFRAGCAKILYVCVQLRIDKKQQIILCLIIVVFTDVVT